MAQAWQKQEIEADIVTSVPLSKRRLRLRGYNQAELLAKTIAHGLGLPYQELLVRKRHVKEQSRLKREERLTNVLGAFAPIDGLDLGGKRVLLVDDVLTTGATTSECSRALLKAGASSVYVLTMARGTGTQRMSS
jgi:ComF family protein